MEELRSLVPLAQSGDLDAYNRIVRRFQDMATGYAYSLLGDVQLAEDAAQEAFISAYLELRSLAEPAAFPGWFRRIVFSQCTRITRGKRVKTAAFEQVPPIPSGQKRPDELLDEKELNARVWLAIMALPEQERAVTTLFYINERSQAEIAAFLEIPVTTVNGRLHTSRKRLKKGLIKMAKDNVKSLRVSRTEEFAERIAKFVEAVDAVVSGDTEMLKSLLKRDPTLARMRSSKEHGAMLIHYVAANGVEDERQRTPANAVDVAKILIDAGAQIDATFLDGGSGTTPLVSLVTSIHPHRAGVAAELVRTFVEAGARVDGIKGDGEPLSLALSFEHQESVQALLTCGAQIENIEIAAGLGALNLVEKFVDGGDITDEELEEAFMSACKYGKTQVAEYLLKRGVDIEAKGWANNTGLMLASQRGRTETVKLLLDYGASIEPTNDFGGTALSSAIYFLINHPVPDADYAGVVELLLNAGSIFAFTGKTTGNDKVDDMLRKRGVITWS